MVLKRLTRRFAKFLLSITESQESWLEELEESRQRSLEKIRPQPISPSLAKLVKMQEGARRELH